MKSTIKLAADYFRIHAKMIKEEWFEKGKWKDKEAKKDYEVHKIMEKDLEELENSEGYSLKTRRKKIYMYKCDTCTAFYSTETKMKCKCGKCDPDDDDIQFPCHECKGRIQLTCISFDTHCRILKKQEEDAGIIPVVYNKPTTH